jgi:AcrR family transcriptional regulator
MTDRRPPRQRLLDAAADLFYRQGTVAVGVDLVSQTAGVSKRTLYQQFGSKDGLIAETLDANGAAIVGRYLPAPDSDDPPRQQILTVFDRLSEWAVSPGYRGCPFINTTAELPDPGHPARRVARRYTRQIRDHFARQATLGGADDPLLLADELIVVFDGAIVQAVMGSTDHGDAAAAAARTLLDAHHLS